MLILGRVDNASASPKECGALRVRWRDPRVAFEQEAVLDILGSSTDVVDWELLVAGPRGAEVLSRGTISADEAIRCELRYPYPELVPGGYEYRVRVEASDGAQCVSDALAFSVTGYHFGC